MATPKDICKRSMRLIGALAAGEEPTANELEDARVALNSYLDSLNSDLGTVYARTRTTKTLTASDGQYSIGSGGDINVTQPIKVEAAGLIQSGDTYESPIHVMTSQDWENYEDKAGTTETIPGAVYFQKSSGTTGTIHVLPIPDAAHTLVLYLGTQFSSIATTDLTTTYSLPAGAQAMIEFGLAVYMAPEYGVAVSPEVAISAVNTLGAFKSMNSEPLRMAADSALLNGGCVFPMVDPTAINGGGY
jgi:hypothetical protein